MLLKTPTPDQVKAPDGLKFNGVIPVEELDITYSRSSGPGGQHVNSVSTKVDIRFKVNAANWLNEDVKKQLIELNKNRLNKDGYLIIKSDRTRSQQLNLADAMTTLRNMIWKAAKPAPQISEDTIDRIRIRQEKQNRERLIEKKMRSMTKAQRRETPVDI
ncbi:peptidyl-tRNA hydrolase ICT1, mitochondrial isoform X3 [Diaphorina citri]|nr:peptidyl-tRNA hydrolase ICT1, mitochondrial isoform X3 [Diaphorina citri]XP_026689127.1 peptidyl-tRNA hydrolase ICT1, mitochondrial isoform X3 [Diaphorina citri]